MPRGLIGAVIGFVGVVLIGYAMWDAMSTKVVNGAVVGTGLVLVVVGIIVAVLP